MDPILGVDLGTTYTAAATNDARGQPEMVALGIRTAEIPSVLLLRSDGEFLVGEAAERRAFGEPDRVARQFKRRLGDATPILLGGSPFSPEALLGRTLRYVVGRAKELRGATFAATVVCHPANYGPYRMELLGQAAKMAEVDDVLFVPEPVAAAVHYTGQAKLDPDEVVVVYDFGGGTFDVAVLRRTGAAFEVIGTPAGLEHLGGLDLDEAVFNHVAQSVGDPLMQLDPGDPGVVSAVGRLRDECKAAKEALSSDTDTSIPVLLPGIQTEVRLTRAEFESMILPSVIDTVATTTRAIRDAGLEPGDVGRILLVGGSARVPLVAQLLNEELGRPIVIDTHPKHAIALGAARWGALQTEAGAHGVAAAEAPQTAAAAATVDSDPLPVTTVDAGPVAPAAGPPVAAETVAPASAPAPAPAEPAPQPTAEPTAPQPSAEPAPQPTAEPAAPAPAPAQATPATSEPRPVAAEPPPIPAFQAPRGRRRVPRAAVVVIAVALAAGGITFGVLQATGGEEKKPTLAEVVVDGDQPFTDTGIDLTRGARVTIDAEGEVFHDDTNSTGPDGVNNPALDPFNVLGGSRHNALIGKIGRSGDPFFVGAHHEFTSDDEGRLFLGINDTGVDNNRGTYKTKIEVDR